MSAAVVECAQVRGDYCRGSDIAARVDYFDAADRRDGTNFRIASAQAGTGCVRGTLY